MHLIMVSRGWVFLLLILMGLTALTCNSSGASETRQLTSLSVNVPGLKPSFSPSAMNYILKASQVKGNELQVTARANFEGQMLKVNGAHISNNSTVNLGHLKADDRVLIQVGSENPSVYSILIVPDDLPEFTVNKINAPSPGYIFLSNLDFNYLTETNPPVGRYLVILDYRGTPIWFYKSVAGKIDFDLEVGGVFSFFDAIVKKYYTIDYQKNIQRSYEVNGYSLTDNHEFILNSDGSFFIAAYVDQVRDLSGLGGASNAIVTEFAVQKLAADNTVLFEWDSWNYFNVSDATSDIDLTRAPPNKIDYAHLNAIKFDDQGFMYLTTKHMSEVTKVNMTTSNIEWRLGGENSTFTFEDDPLGGFSHPHSAIITDKQTLLIYDNGTTHSPPQSRAAEYELNTVTNKARLVWQFSYPNHYTAILGSVQRLAGGNTFIGWGGFTSPVAFTEVKPDGTIALEVSMSENNVSYRALKLDYSPPFLAPLP